MKKLSYFTLAYAVVLPIIFHMPLSIAMPAVVAQPASLCLKEQLSVHLSDRDGLYDGMSHSGMELILKNISKELCTLPAVPELSFSDSQHRPLPVKREITHGMHPGPVLLPIGVGAGEDVRISLHWVSENVFEHGRCVRPAFISLQLPDGLLNLPFDKTMCAVAGQSGYYLQSLFAMSDN